MSRYSQTKHADIDRLRATIDDARVKVIKHPLYRRLETLEQGNHLYKQHVFNTSSTSSRSGNIMPLPKPFSAAGLRRRAMGAPRRGRQPPAHQRDRARHHGGEIGLDSGGLPGRCSRRMVRGG